MLLEKEAKISILNSDEKSPLDLAQEQNNQNLIQILTESIHVPADDSGICDLPSMPQSLQIKRSAEDSGSEVKKKDYIDNKEIKDFFDALVFAVNQPNEVELSGIKKDEIGVACKLIDSDLITADIRRVMLDWFKGKEEKAKYLLAISDVDEARLRRLVPKDHQISLFQEYDRDKSNNIRSILLKTGQAAEQFEQLCQQYPALNIHWLKSESDQLIWQQSQGPLSGLHQYIEKD
uniref:Uncharacterized protein n=1 Tax=Acrobeloides nanus TaxID=290746 RepID=A0A914DNI0_9BILA